MPSAGVTVGDKGGAYFGILLQNYCGWWLTVFTTFALYPWLLGKGPKPGEASLDRLALGSYLVRELGIVIASLVNGAGGQALIGFFVMTPLGMVAGRMKMA